MKKMSIYEPALCCETGLCGVNVDPELLRITTVLNNLKNKGIIIERYNLNSTPNVTFEPGCRNNWHVHHGDKGGGQIFACTSGRGYYQEWGKEAQELHPGENTSNEWLESVSNEDYNKLK